MKNLDEAWERWPLLGVHIFPFFCMGREGWREIRLRVL
jgi:hypothetical protein